MNLPGTTQYSFESHPVTSRMQHTLDEAFAAVRIEAAFYVELLTLLSFWTWNKRDSPGASFLLSHEPES